MAISRGSLLVIGVAGGALLLAGATAVWVWSRQAPKVPGMAFIRGGTFASGSDKRPIDVKSFYIDITEVSNVDFAAYCVDSASCKPPSGAPDLPVVGITVEQARAYAASKGKRLPTAFEWERAAQGSEDGARYPWGFAEDASFANVADNPLLKSHQLMPVRSFAAYPEYQMTGNAWEMVEGTVTPDGNAVAKFFGLLSPPPTAEERWIEIRGGSFNTPIAASGNDDAQQIPERYSAPDIGFRCARNP